MQNYPRRFGKYVLLSPLAQGGMGELHLAYSGRAELKKLCAIKTILGHLADEEFLNRFVDEAKVVVKLSHGNLVPVFEAGEVEGQVFVAMEYIEGKDLRDLWHRLQSQSRTCSLEVALYIVREICRGLHYVHTYEDLHLVHRDVSPPNVLLSYSGEVRLTDFGVATSTIKLQKTAPGILLGKLSYMSPEQARNDAVDARADIFSVGVILWELLTGHRLFPPEKSQLARYERAIKPQIVPPSRVRANLPPALDLIALRALSPEPEGRYAEVELLRQDLASQLAQLAPTTDASAVQGLLRELYGAEIEGEREDRRLFLESIASRVQRLMDATSEPGKPQRSISPVARQPTVSFRPGEGPDAPVASDVPTMDYVASPDEDTGAIPRIAPGTLLGTRYRIERLIGEGGMGTVYTATHVDIEKQVAVKVLHPVYGRMPDVVSRFRAEARAASRIGHPHIVEVYDSGTTDDGSIYFVMEHLTGVDLAEVLDGEGQLAIQRALRLAAQIGEAVAAAHEAGIVHRDLKPENIFLVAREGDPDFVKVLDFGIAKSTGLENTRAQRLTHPGMAMGTPEYMAPEQAAGRPTDHRVDIYATGALLYEMLVGKPPHEGENMMAVLSAKATEPVVPPRQLRPEIPQHLEDLVLWALQYAPEDRPQTMAQMCYELTKLTRGRAGAVASILGIPDISGPPAGPILPHATGGRSEPSAESLAADGAPSTPARPRGLLPSSLVLPALALIILGLLAAVISLLLRPSVGKDVHLPISVDGAPLIAALPAADSGGPGAAPTSGDDAGSHPTDRGQTARRFPVRIVRFSAQQHLSNGRQHLGRGRFSLARMNFEAASRQKSTRGPALVGLAEVDFQLSHYGAAEQHARSAVTQGGGIRARLVLGNIYFKLKDYNRAISMYRAVITQGKKTQEAQEARRNLSAALRLQQHQQ